MNALPPEVAEQIHDAQARLLGEFQAAWQDLDGLLADLAARPVSSRRLAARRVRA
jgi:hypothetical protein